VPRVAQAVAFLARILCYTACQAQESVRGAPRSASPANACLCLCVVLCALCCSLCPVLFSVPCVVLCALCCSLCPVLFSVPCVVLCALCCSLCPVLFSVPCVVLAGVAVYMGPQDTSTLRSSPRSSTSPSWPISLRSAHSEQKEPEHCQLLVSEPYPGNEPVKLPHCVLQYVMYSIVLYSISCSTYITLYCVYCM